MVQQNLWAMEVAICYMKPEGISYDCEMAIQWRKEATFLLSISLLHLAIYHIDLL